MRYSLIPAALLAASLVGAVPTTPSLDTLGSQGLIPSVAERVYDSVHKWWSSEEVSGEDIYQGIKIGSVRQDGVLYDTLTHPSHPEYRLRITSESHRAAHPAICDPDVKQISGYLDISENKHLFFWFFESRSSPSEDPLVLWLNGGPGCSSTTGLLFELGPCQVAKEGKDAKVNVTDNQYSWTNKANVIFLDQPVGVGYSYSDDEQVNNSPAAAEDVYAFLTLFVGKYSKYRKNDFHISGESYAGTYLPNIAHVIHNENKRLLSMSASARPLPILNFKSVLIGNGLSQPDIQFASVPEYACDSEYAVYEDPQGSECTSLRSKMSRCENLAKSCFKTNSKFTCVPAELICWNGFGQLQDLGLNMYDTRKKCDRSEDADGPLCYRQMGWIEEYMNSQEVKNALGAPKDVKFQSCNMDINRNFLFNGDVMRETSLLMVPLVNEGIRLLIYAGVRDLMCNYIGNEQWVDVLPTKYNEEFMNSTATPFIDSDKKETGYVRSAGKGAGNVAFMAIYDAGHMVPQDQPVASLDMLQRWLDNKPLAHGK
ncbi:hypothetical protein QFC21_002567 [Naganishia friedmannii]|uniref:Uncharacterized protein n=1 Tax=Naganishia friedmannii TaxID=89922 RepID=A0ACC2VVL7_9TREE|nr:hypothetical protein QFC21_002567 [Naganishia friedmannii]